MTASSNLRILGREFEGFRRAVAAHAERSPAGTVEATWLDLPALADAVFADTVEADVLLVPADWLPALAARGTIAPLTAELAEDPPDGWPDAWSPSFHEGVRYGSDTTPGDDDGLVYGLPFHDGPQLFFSRPSLLAEHGLAVPRTWPAALTAMRTVHTTGGTSGTVLAGAPDGHNNVYDLVLHLWRHGGELLGANGRPILDSLAMRDALVALRELVALAPPDAHALDSTASGAAFAGGGIAVSLNWAGYAALAAAGSVADDFVCSIAPTHDDGTPTTTVNAFWAACITASTPHPGRAWAHLRHAASPAMDLATTLAGATGCRLSTWSDAEALVRHPEYALFERAHSVSRPLPRLPELPALVGVLSDLVDAVVWCGAAPDPALGRAQRAADDLFATSTSVSSKELTR